jgi:hypothetical protein
LGATRLLIYFSIFNRLDSKKTGSGLPAHAVATILEIEIAVIKSLIIGTVMNGAHQWRQPNWPSLPRLTRWQGT